MTHGQAVICRRVARAKAGAAERGADDGACLHEVVDGALLDQVREDRLGRGVDGERELAGAAALAAQRVGRLHDVGVVAARAAGDYALLHVDAGGVDLAHKIQRTFTAGDLVRCALDLRQDVARVGVELVDGVDVAGVEGQGDHGTDLGEVHAHAAVVVGDVCRIKLAVIVRASVVGKVATRVIIRTPNGGEAGGLRGHDVHAVAEVRGHGRDAGAHKLHHLVLDVAAREDGANDGERHVLRANKGLAGTLKVDGDNIILPQPAIISRMYWWITAMCGGT